MKNLAVLLISLLLLNFNFSGNNDAFAQEDIPVGKAIQISCSPDMYNLVNGWSADYKKLNPDIEIIVNKADLSDKSFLSMKSKQLVFFHESSSSDHVGKEFWKMVIAWDALVPVMNSKNPYLDEIKEQNISSFIYEQLKQDQKVWNVVPGDSKSSFIRFYMVNNGLDETRIRSFIKSGKKVDAELVENDDKLISSVLKDKYAMGFCRLSNLLASTDPAIYKNIVIMPLDKNGNNKIDEFENTYLDVKAFFSKLWFGKFPNELSIRLYSAATVKPEDSGIIAFLQWISAEGQTQLNLNGYAAIDEKEKQTNIKLLANQPENIESSDASGIIGFFSSITKTQYGFAAFILVLIAFIIIMNVKKAEGKTLNPSPYLPGIFDESSIRVPEGIYFDKTHTWTYMEKDGNVRLGIDDFMQHVTGIITRIKMRNPGEKIKKGEPIVTIIKDGKHLSINSPVTGRITELNENLVTNPEKLNLSPFSEGWVYRVEPSNWMRELQFFTMAEKYREWLKNEFVRLKDFLTSTIQAKNPAFVNVALQDGGTIKDHVLADLDPDIWEEFQANFIDTMK